MKKERKYVGLCDALNLTLDSVIMVVMFPLFTFVKENI